MFRKTVLNCFMAATLASLAFLVSCDSCESSNLYEKRCDGTKVEECQHSDGWDSEEWKPYTDCAEGCPASSGGIPKCSSGSCTCSFPENTVCDSTNYYRCNSSNIEKCTRLENYNGAVWQQVKNCSSAFASNGAIVEGGTCPLESGKEAYSEPNCAPKIKKAFRGKWRRLDKDQNYYLGTNGITYYDSSTLVLPTHIVRIDDNMIELTANDETFRLIRNSITDAKLKLNVKSAASLTRSPSGAGVGGIDVIIENTSDEGEVYEQQSGSNGETEFNGIVSGGYYISVGNTTIEQNVSDYLNAGNFYLGSKGYIYKTTKTQNQLFYSEDRNDSAEGNQYNITLEIHNLGDTDAPATSISLTTNDSAVNLTAEPKILGTIEPGSSVSYSFSIETIPFDTISSLKNAAYHDVEFSAAVKDSKGEIWEDVITVRIYKKEVPIYLYSTMSNPFILLSPHRTIMSMSNVVWVPYRPDAKYKLIAQSLSLSNEGAYAIGVGTWDNEKWESEKKNPDIITSYEPNDLESEAKTIYMNSQITSYLNKGEKDIDFWIIDMSK